MVQFGVEGTTSILDALHEQERQKTKDLRKTAARRRGMVKLMEEHILPLMPHSLADCYNLQFAGPSWGLGNSVNLTFEPRVDMFDRDSTKRAVGTIDKVVEGLRQGGWAITRPPEVTADQFRKDMSIELVARRTNGQAIDSLIMIFTGIRTTERCRLVEKQVIIGAVAEHTETKLVVECDEEPAP